MRFAGWRSGVDAATRAVASTLRMSLPGWGRAALGPSA
jgi:hypothetical protein